MAEIRDTDKAISNIFNALVDMLDSIEDLKRRIEHLESIHPLPSLEVRYGNPGGSE